MAAATSVISWVRVSRATFDGLAAYVEGRRYDVLEADNTITQYVTGSDCVPRTVGAGGHPSASLASTATPLQLDTGTQVFDFDLSALPVA